MEASATFPASPKPTIASPQQATAMIVISPCRRSPEKEPENSPPSTEPSGMAA